MRIIVSGKLAGAAGQGGATWAVLQYLLGLRRLGHDVWFVEPVKTLEHKSGAYFRAIVEEFGLAGRAALLPAGVAAALGVSYSHLREVVRSADALLNIS